MAGRAFHPRRIASGKGCEKAKRVMQAMLKMTKLDIKALKEA